MMTQSKSCSKMKEHVYQQNKYPFYKHNCLCRVLDKVLLCLVLVVVS